MGTLPKAFSFQILHRSSKSLARVGKISTLHGDIHTPSFVSVGTNASVKGLTSQQILSTNLELLFCNTFHLLVHPGVDTIQQAGGIHRFMNYKGPIITDSGGFQVFSLRREPLELLARQKRFAHFFNTGKFDSSTKENQKRHYCIF
ncbi:queuine tRNA-ribosyltransferase-like [Zophobas morio]|uniref:queuine tRNA-ribosyltransferase-like n=1 Tax=Zophobas morio TaxID=2755281 RepID=UPI0030828737